MVVDGGASKLNSIASSERIQNHEIPSDREANATFSSFVNPRRDAIKSIRQQSADNFVDICKRNTYSRP